MLLLIVAFLYASVGHGGASGYLAVLSLLAVGTSHMKTSALVLNIIVSAISFYHFYKEGYFDWKLFWPFAITSVPMAFLGATVPVSDVLYKQLLGVCLLFAVARISGLFDHFLKNEKRKTKNETQPSLHITHYAFIIGALIGLLSGMLGIGGGIILSPILLLMGWAGMKQTAAVSALFIFVNSIAGLVGLLQKGIEINPEMYSWIACATVGGLVGGYLGSKKFNFATLKYILALVLLIASVKLMMVK